MRVSVISFLTFSENGTEKMEEEAPDDWADKDDGSGSQTPEDSGGGAEEQDMESEEEEKPAKPAKQRQLSESGKKKSHLNIVFIGHVGMLDFISRPSIYSLLIIIDKFVYMVLLCCRCWQIYHWRTYHVSGNQNLFLGVVLSVLV